MVRTLVIHDSPLAHEARAWDELLEDLTMVERRLGWRYLWEGGNLLRRVECAQAAALENHAQACAWVPASEFETENRRRILIDLSAYERAFAAIARAIAAWPTSASHAPEPKIADLAGAVAP